MVNTKFLYVQTKYCDEEIELSAKTEIFFDEYHWAGTTPSFMIGSTISTCVGTIAFCFELSSLWSIIRVEKTPGMLKRKWFLVLKSHYIWQVYLIFSVIMHELCHQYFVLYASHQGRRAEIQNYSKLIRISLLLIRSCWVGSCRGVY